MYETDNERSLGLDPETRRRMREVFEGQTCSRCGTPAARLSGGEFYCTEHFPRRTAGELYQPRVYHCSMMAQA